VKTIRYLKLYLYTSKEGNRVSRDEKEGVTNSKCLPERLTTNCQTPNSNIDNGFGNDNAL